MKQISNVEIVRLRAIADLMDTIQPKRFNLNSWVTELPQPAKKFLGLFQIEPECGFAGCAMGWAAHERLFANFTVKDHYPVYFDAHNKKHTLWDAVTVLLGISSSMAIYLFGENQYKLFATPDMVSVRIRKFISKIEAIRARDRRRQAGEKPVLSLVC